MADIRPFRAVRPAKKYADLVAALPYDVYSREEAAAAVAGKELSFLNIDRPETMFDPSHDMYADDVYQAAKERYEKQKAEGIYEKDAEPAYYIYEETMNGRSQAGICAVTAVDDYLNGVCRKHENTVEAKERDRIRHVDTMSAQTGPIFLAYHADPQINAITSGWMGSHAAENDFVSEDGIRHRVWKIDDAAVVGELQKLFGALDCTYIADGHHRAASAVKVALKRREEARAAGREDPDAEYNYFLSVLFPDDQLEIMDYNRVVKDLNGMTTDDFLEALEEVFEVSLTSLLCFADDDKEACEGARGFRAPAGEVLKPKKKYEVGMYLEGRSYMLKVKPEYAEKLAGDPVRSLDVSVLQEEVLAKLLNIRDPRTDSRIRFIGGIRGLGELVRDADAYTAETKKAESAGGTQEAKNTGNAGAEASRGPAVAFAMYPTSIGELFAVADAGRLMPPKSTWFEPKLRSGLFIHEF